MEQIASNVYVETQIRGCNHGFVTTSEGVVMIDSPHKPSDALKLKAEIAKHGELRYIINTEPHATIGPVTPSLTLRWSPMKECETASSTPTWKSTSLGLPTSARRSRRS